MQQRSLPGTLPPGVLFDTAVSRIDDALAMALLYGFDGKKDIRVVSVSVSRTNLKAAIFCDVVGRFYAGAVSGAIGFNGRTLPTGLSASNKLTADETFFIKPVEKKLETGKPAYESDIHRYEDTAEVGPVMRNALTAQHDGNAIVVATGPATDLAELLDMGGAKELIARKVKFLVFEHTDLNIKPDIAAARKVFAEWPTPIVCAGNELSDAVRFPAASIEKDFAWSPAHPVADAYRAAQPMPYDAPTGAMSAVLYAARPQEQYFRLSEPGLFSVSNEGQTKFDPSPNGRHKYLIFDPAKKDSILKTYTELASAKPVEKPQRVFTPKKQQDAVVVPKSPAQ